MVIINDLVLKKSDPYIIPSEDDYINLATNQNYIEHIGMDNPSQEINIYPGIDNKYKELLKLIGIYTNNPINNILLTHGSGESLKLILNTFTNIDTKILIPTPNYPGFIHDAELKLSNVNQIYFNGLIDDIMILETYIKENDIIYLSIPNLPLGYEINQINLLNIIIKYPKKLFLIDEAYIEYGKNESYAKYTYLNNIIVIRTFSKAFALAGARLGYIICNSNLMKYLKIHYCTKTVTRYAIKCGLNVMKNLDYYLNNVKEDIKNWTEFYENCKLYIKPDDIIHDISYHSGAYCLLYTDYPKYIVNIFKKHKYLIRDKSNDVMKNCVRISLSLKNIMDELFVLIKKINGYYIYDTYYIDIDDTIRKDKNSSIYPGIVDALKIIKTRTNSKIMFITNNIDNHENIEKYLNDHNVMFDKLISPFQNYNITDLEYTNGWFIRKDKLYIIKYPLISTHKDLYYYIDILKKIYIVETSILEDNNPFVGYFLKELKQKNINYNLHIIGKENLLIENVNKNSIVLGDSILDYKFAYNNNIFYYNNKNLKGTLDFLNHKAIISLSNNHTKLISMLNKIIFVFNILNLSFWADCGTLLGAVRYNKILPWDEDCDLGILQSDEDIIINNIDLFKKYKLRIQKNKSTKAYWQVDTLYDYIGPIDPNLHIDIFVFIKENNKYINADYRFQNPDFEIGHCNIAYYENELFPLTTLKFYDKDIPVPNKYDNVLKRSLGDDYLYKCIIKNYINETDIKLLECNLNNKFNDKFII